MSPCMSFMTSFITKVKIYGLNSDSWCNPILIRNTLDSSSHIVITYSDVSHNICVHILDKDNIFCWNFVLFKRPLHDIYWYFIIRFQILLNLNIFYCIWKWGIQYHVFGAVSLSQFVTICFQLSINNSKLKFCTKHVIVKNCKWVCFVQDQAHQLLIVIYIVH
jgi:hypothetical protein